MGTLAATAQWMSMLSKLESFNIGLQNKARKKGGD